MKSAKIKHRIVNVMFIKICLHCFCSKFSAIIFYSEDHTSYKVVESQVFFTVLYFKILMLLLILPIVLFLSVYVCRIFSLKSTNELINMFGN